MSLLLPEKFPVKFYSWQDQDAPRLENVDGCIKTILKACLVTGYGDKQGVGWTALFEDDYRIVLRRPLRTGNPPDIKIENGVINGMASHRIVAQNNPLSLDDNDELSHTFLLARDRTHKKEWYLIACDFAFILCYNMGEDGHPNQVKQNILYVGGAKKIIQDQEEPFFACHFNNKNGFLTPWYTTVFHSSNLKNLKDGKSYKCSNNIIGTSVDYDIAQPIWTDIAQLPFYNHIMQMTNTSTQRVILQQRPFLRYLNQSSPYGGTSLLYIPLDYWEL